MEIYSFAQLHTPREIYPPDPHSDPQGGSHILKEGIRKKIMLLVAQDSSNKIKRHQIPFIQRTTNKFYTIETRTPIGKFIFETIYPTKFDHKVVNLTVGIVVIGDLIVINPLPI